MSADDPTADRPIPSPRAARRLQGDIHDAIDDYRVRLDDDLGLMGGAVRHDLPDEAVGVMRGHIQALERMQAVLHKIVAGAVVEREAERVLDDVRADVLPEGHLMGEEPPAPAATPVTPRARRALDGRRRILAAAAMLSLAAGLADQLGIDLPSRAGWGEEEVPSTLPAQATES